MKYKGKYKGGWAKLREERYARQIKMGLIKKEWSLSPEPENVRKWENLSDEEKSWEDFRMATYAGMVDRLDQGLSLIHISEPTRPRLISYAVFCLKKKK